MQPLCAPHPPPTRGAPDRTKVRNTLHPPSPRAHPRSSAGSLRDPWPAGRCPRLREAAALGRQGQSPGPERRGHLLAKLTAPKCRATLEKLPLKAFFPHRVGPTGLCWKVWLTSSMVSTVTSLASGAAVSERPHPAAKERLYVVSHLLIKSSAHTTKDL